ncbi:MAG: hypothetical protein Q9157_003918 [Trypethelium eluteriae]
MIEDINGVSGQLSRTSRADDPVSAAAANRFTSCFGEEIANLRGKQLSQIVRVLNSHLFSLQQIDQSATQLQTKVAAAQKDTQRMGTNGYHGIGTDTADDFYRSWMGSRRHRYKTQMSAYFPEKPMEISGYLEAAPPDRGAPVSPSAIIREATEKLREAMRGEPKARVARSTAREVVMMEVRGQKGI